MVLHRSSFFPDLFITIGILAVLLRSSTVFATCTCRPGTNVFSENANPSGTRGVFRTADAACENAASMCLQGSLSCRGGPCERVLNCGSTNRIETRITDTFGTRFQCRVTCTGPVEQCGGPTVSLISPSPSPSPSPTPSPQPSGEGRSDPHLTGFDGTRFDFHGEHEKHYLLFGRSKGDSLVSRIRSTKEVSPKTLAKQTYFDGFGLQLSNCPHRISLALVPDQESSRHWRPQVLVNGEEVETSQHLGCVDVHIDTGRRTVTMKTAEAKYSFASKLRRKEEKRHIDVNVQLLRKPERSDTYFGVLGFTMNKVLGHEVHPDLNVASREKVELENSLRSRFQVDSLFSSYKKDSTDLLYMVRMISGRDHTNIPLRLSAEVISY